MLPKCKFIDYAVKMVENVSFNKYLLNIYYVARHT